MTAYWLFMATWNLFNGIVCVASGVACYSKGDNRHAASGFISGAVILGLFTTCLWLALG
jgi:hypothetical protein